MVSEENQSFRAAGSRNGWVIGACSAPSVCSYKQRYYDIYNLDATEVIIGPLRHVMHLIFILFKYADTGLNEHIQVEGVYAHLYLCLREGKVRLLMMNDV